MNKQQVVATMVEVINNQNRVSAVSSQVEGQKMQLSDIEKLIEQMQPQLNQMCSTIYDALLAKNIISAE